MFLHIERVTQKEGYEFRIQFSDGVVKDVDLNGELLSLSATPAS